MCRRARLEGAPKRPSTYRVVFWSKGRWKAETSLDGHPQYIGMYDDEEEAARAYDEIAKQLRDNPILNFLPDGSLNPNRKSKYVGSRSKRLMCVGSVSCLVAADTIPKQSTLAGGW